MKINWIPVNLQDELFDMAALTFGIPIVNAQENAIVQFDTGCPKSTIYVPTYVEEKQLSINLGPRLKTMPAVKDDLDNEFRLLLGVDLLQDLLVEIDFDNDEIKFLDTNHDVEDYQFIQGKKDSTGRIRLPLSIEKNKIVEVLYDSGASLFDVTSTQKLAKNFVAPLKGKSRNLVLPPYSHPDGDKELTFDIYDIDQPLQMGPLQRPNFELSLHDSTSPHLDFAQYDPPIFGLIGNKFFSGQSAIILDLKNSRIGIK